ncbi:MAG TPA: aminoglycoside phosphotransferase family protein [Bryobacteraceae bacterium]
MDEDAVAQLAAGLARRWSVTLLPRFSGAEGSGSWVAPAVRADGTPAVLKIGMRHFEGEHEIAGLRLWNGDGMVRILESDDASGAMLLERCEPDTTLRELPEAEQNRVIASLLRRLWRAPSVDGPFRQLAAQMRFWSEETLASRERWAEAGLVHEGLRLFDDLPRTATSQVLLATDLHAGNVLRSQREPWLGIDPKPFVGDPAYDPTQHLFNCETRMRADPHGTIRRMADLLEVDAERVRLWVFARAAAEPRDDWRDERLLSIARSVFP